MRCAHAKHGRTARKKQAASAKRARELSSCAFSAKRSNSPNSESALSLLVHAAVAARGALPPGFVAGAVHGSLQLIHVAHEVALAPLQRLLELLELPAPALHTVLAQLNVRLELRLA